MAEIVDEHGWVKLYTLQASRYQQANPEYSGIEYCPRCKRLRTAPDGTFFYMRFMKDPNVKERKKPYVPACVEEAG